MATYLYETVPSIPGEAVLRFEIKQSMKEPALTAHPETGQPVRRIITGGAGLMGVGQTTTTTSSSGGSCGTGCGCH